MGLLIVYDGAHLTLGASSESMNLVGDVGLTVSHIDASGNEEQILEVTPTGPDFVYLSATLEEVVGVPNHPSVDASGWWYPLYLTESDANSADAIYRGICDASGSSHELTFYEFSVHFYLPSIFCIEPQEQACGFGEQVGAGNNYSTQECDDCINPSVCS